MAKKLHVAGKFGREEGVVKSVNGVVPDAEGNVSVDVPEGFSGSWNDLADRPFSSETVLHTETIFDGSVVGGDTRVILDDTEKIAPGTIYHLSISNGSDVNYADLVAKSSFNVESMITYVRFYDSDNVEVAYFNTHEGSLNVWLKLPSGDYSICLYSAVEEEIVNKLDAKYIPYNVLMLSDLDMDALTVNSVPYFNGYNWSTYNKPIRIDHAIVTYKDGYTEFLDIKDGICYEEAVSYDDRPLITSIKFPRSVTTIARYAFRYYTNLVIEKLPPKLKVIESDVFSGCECIRELTFTGKAETIAPSAFESCHNLTAINVPWAEGEVAGAPWGARKATINYNYEISE